MAARLRLCCDRSNSVAAGQLWDKMLTDPPPSAGGVKRLWRLCGDHGGSAAAERRWNEMPTSPPRPHDGEKANNQLEMVAAKVGCGHKHMHGATATRWRQQQWMVQQRWMVRWQQ